MTTEELRHLLEMAAKACGIQVDERGPFTEVPCMQSEFGKGNWIESSRRAWIPDIDDGDSARMRSALLIDVYMQEWQVVCTKDRRAMFFEKFADHNNDRDAALRLCALRVAAAIGEGMK